MRKSKIVLSILRSDFACWVNNYKLYITIIILSIFTLDNYATSFEYAKQVRCRVSPFLFPFLFTHPFMHLVIFTSIIFVFSNAPFANGMQLLLISRTGKKTWLISQVIYLIISSILITLFLILLPILRHIDMIVLKNDWGKVWKNLSINYEVINPALYDTINKYSAIEALIYTIVLFNLMVIFLGIIIMFFNIFINNKSIGILVASAFPIIDLMYMITGNSKILWLSPLSWINISKISVNRDCSIPTIQYGIGWLSIVSMMLIVIICVCAKNKDVVEINE